MRRADSFIDALKACEEARNNPNRVQICRTAQEKYEVCKQKQTQWSTKRTALLAQLNQRRPDLGHSCLVPAIRGMSVPSGTQKTDQWNCALSSLRTLQMPGCPGFLPSSFQTPLQALAVWNEEDRRRVSGASTDKAEAASQSANLATDLFQQSAAKASKLANDPQTTAKLAAAAKARENEINKLTNDGIERQSAIMDAAVGAFVENVTTSLQSGSYGNTGGSSDLFGALGNTMTNIKQYAPADAGVNATSAGLIAGSDLGVEPGSKNAFVQSKVLAKGTSCQERKASLEREFPEINARQPRNASTVSQLQAILYMTERSIAEFSTADCSSDPNSSANLAEYRQAHANTLKTCRQVASNPNDCIAKISW